VSCSRLHSCGHPCEECERLQGERDLRLQDARDNGILTVGELRRWLSGLDDLTQVLVGSPDGGYLNIDDAILPDGEDYQALTLFTADTYDSRQF
jgi:hypothetical protein